MPYYILVVEDEPVLADLITEILEEEGGYRVAQATNAVDALLHIQATPPDLLVLDLMLPRLDGFDLMAALADAGIHLPVVVLTANQQAYEVACQQWGEARCLLKPFEVPALLRCVAGALTPAILP